MPKLRLGKRRFNGGICLQTARNDHQSIESIEFGRRYWSAGAQLAAARGGRRHASRLRGVGGALFDLVPLINKGSDRNRVERKTLGQANQSSKQAANERKKAALSIAAHLMRERREFRLPRRKSQLAQEVWEKLPTIERPTKRNIRRWITEWLKPQK